MKPYLLSDGHTIINNFRGTILALQNNIPALGAKGNPNQICKLVHTILEQGNKMF